MQDQTSAAALRALLFNIRETRPTSHIYVLLDNASPVSSAHALHPDNLAARPTVRKSISVGESNDSADTQSWCPSLLQLYVSGENGYADDELVDLTWQCALDRCASINGAYVVAWIATDQSPAALARQLARNNQVFDMASGRQANMHLHQPYRMALVAGAHDDKAFLNSRLEAIHAWLYVDAAGTLETLRPESSCTGRAGRPSLALCRALNRVPLGRQVLLGIRKAEMPVPQHAERAIDGLLVLAAEQGLTHAEDVIFFVLNTLSLSPHWFKHPVAAELIQRTRAEGAPIVGLFAELPDDLLEDIGNWYSSP